MDDTERGVTSAGATGWHVHLCTMISADETGKQDVADDWLSARDWLRDHGHLVVAQWSDPLEQKLAAARTCDLCILLLGKTFGPRDPRSSFSDPELEVSAAADVHPDKVLVFTRTDAQPAQSPEQGEFITRMSNFAQGTLRSRYQNEVELRSELERALDTWTPPREVVIPRPVEPGSIMISSTGDLKDERGAVREVLREELCLPVIDYQHEPSESVTPLDRVLSWARECRALVLILGEHFGSVSRVDGLGITELEFVTALRARRPILAFVGPGAENTKDEDQQQFLERVNRFVPETRVHSFSDPTELRQRLRTRLPEVLGEGIRIPLPAVPEDIQLRWYHRQITRWLGRLPHPWQPGGMELDQVFVSVNALPAPSAAQTDADDKPKPLPADEAISRYPRLVLQAEAGAGKTVALRWYAISADHAAVPVYVRLSAYARALEEGTVTSLETYLRQEERRLLLGAETGDGLWMPLLRAGRGIVLLDGLDEVTTRMQGGDGTISPREQVTRDILALAAQLPAATPIVVATRTLDGGGSDLVRVFTRLAVQALDSTQQRQLVLQWLHTSHPTNPLIAVRTTQRVLDVLEAQQRLSAWAGSPLMLTLLTALIDAGDVGAIREMVSKADILRRAMRLILGQWSTLAVREENEPHARRRLGGRYLWPKEQLLLHVAWATCAAGSRGVIDEEDVRTAWQELSPRARAMCDAPTLLDELSDQDGFLPRTGENQYGFYHAAFQEYLAAAWMALTSMDQRQTQMARKRLHTAWDEMTQLLVSELDRLGRPNNADAVIQTLLDADGQPLPAVAWPDPAHLALRRAARAQGGRIATHAHAYVAAQLAKSWARLLEQHMGEEADNEWVQGMAYQALLDMGASAIAAGPLLRRIATRSFPPPAAIEALGNSGTPDDVAILISLLKPGEGIGEQQAAALRGLLRLGADVVRSHRDLLPRFVWAQSSSIGSILADSGGYAAALLIQLSPTREDLAAIARLDGRWRQEALWAAARLPLADAIPLLREGIDRSDTSFLRVGTERSAFDFRGDTLIDDRYAALAASAGLGEQAVPLLLEIIFRSIYDVARNQRLAESIILALGAAAIPAMRAHIDDWIRNEEAREHYFGAILASLDRTTDPEQVRSLLAQAVAGLREIARIRDQQLSPRSNESRTVRAARIQQEGVAPRTLDQVLQILRTAGAQNDELVREILITHALDTIAHMGPSAAAALEAILAFVHDPRHRRQAMAALAGLGAAAAPALPILEEALGDQDALVRARAVEALGNLGGAARPALPLLGSLLKDGRHTNAGLEARSAEREVRCQAVIAWGRLWPLTRPLLSDVLEVLQSDPDGDVRATVVDMFGRVADADPQVLNALHRLAQAAPSHSMWEATLADEARAALESVLARVEDAGDLSRASPSSSDGSPLRNRRWRWLERLGTLRKRLPAADDRGRFRSPS